MHEKITEDTIAAISTPIGEGGIGIVRLSGSLALKIAESLFISKDKVRAGKFKTYTVHYGHIVDKIRNPKSEIRNKPKPIDEVIVTVMKAPKSYTREDVVEINCHGGIQAVKKVLGLVIKNGARMAEPGEFTKRAFLNGRLDLSQAESVLDVIRAKTENSLRIAMDQLGGELSGKIDKIRDNIINMTSQIEASIDFPDEEPEVLDRKGLERSSGAILKELKTLIDSYNEGIIFREGVLAIICGKPNVGKSSLMNLLLKRDRVIVSPIPGTTRDAVEEMINLKGIPIRLVDTAGIGQAKDILEREGASKSKKYLELADIVIMMLDGSTKIDKADLDIIKLVKDKRKLIVINKSDLAKKIEIEKIGKLFKGEKMIGISVRERRNIKLLEDAVAGLIWRGDFSQAEGLVVSNIRHKELLDKSLESMLSVKSDLEKKISPELVVVDLKEAINSLGLIIGKTISDDILDKIFEQFCIGK